jgi:hypothetical protein
MPVQKFRTIEEMNDAPTREPGRPDFERFVRHCSRYWLMTPRAYPRGVFRFRTMEDARRARDNH